MSKVLEILWFVISVFCLWLGIDRTLKFGIKHSYQLFIIAIIAFLFLILRRYLRKKEKAKE